MHNEVQKIEILPQIKKRFINDISEDIYSMKFCQSKDNTFLEFIFKDDLNSPKILDLDFKKDKKNEILLHPLNDFLENLMLFLKFETITLTLRMGFIFKNQNGKGFSEDYNLTGAEKVEKRWKERDEMNFLFVTQQPSGKS